MHALDTLREPDAIATALAVAGVLLAAAVLLGRLSWRIGLPFVLVFLLVGMIAGDATPSVLHFDDPVTAFRVGTLALVLILFDAGLQTPWSSARKVLAPSALLASVGVFFTALITALGCRLLGMSWATAALVGAVTSSTDAAAVFAVLRGSGLRLRQRLAATLEFEAGLNDPVAVILTLAVTAAIASPATSSVPHVLGETFLQLAVGMAVGVGAGLLGRLGLERVHLTTGGLYPVLTTALAATTYGVATLTHGSGFLAVYVAALILGRGNLRYRSGLVRVHEGLAWLSQVVMFLLLGLMVRPASLLPTAPIALGVVGVLALVARPVVVAACLLPFRYSAREIAYVSWIGLRGAVPIVLAIFPVMAGLEVGSYVFHVVFFVVLANALVPGATVRWVTRLLGMQSTHPPPPLAALEITSTGRLDGDILVFRIDPAAAVCDATLADIPMPLGSSVMIVMRGPELVVARGGTTLEPGDHVYVFAKHEDKPLVMLLFGDPIAE